MGTGKDMARRTMGQWGRGSGGVMGHRVGKHAAMALVAITSAGVRVRVRVRVRD